MKQHPEKIAHCDFDPGSVSVDQASRRIIKSVSAIQRTETIPLSAAYRRVLAENLVSDHNVPNHTNSAMDGYAVLCADLLSSDTVKLTLIGSAFAGNPYPALVSRGQCVRIMTGAIMPAGTNTVVIQEDADVIGHQIQIKTTPKPGSNVRQAGEDISAGAIAIKKGTKLNAAQLGVIASLGKSHVRVFKKPRVAFFSNGNELKSVGQPLQLGEVYDSNRHTLRAMLTELDVEIIDFGIVRDRVSAITETLETASQQADIVISTAGASVGDADYIKEVLDDMGEVNFWKVAIKPGRPLAFGKIKKALFFGLPGNPVSVMVTFQIFVSKAINILSGQTEAPAVRLKAKTRTDIKKRPGRMEFQRGILSLNNQGESVVDITGEQGSGILSSMSIANCFIILHQECAGLKAGEWVEIQPF